VIEKVLEAAVDQYKLVISERQLTQETLLGCLQVMLEMLTTVQPEAFSQSTRVHRYVREIAAAMNLKDRWQIEAAAMLLQIGWMTLPPDILTKAIAGESMSPEEQTAFAVHPSAAARILEQIPRLGTVARMVEGQHGSLKGSSSVAGVDGEVAALGAQVLKAAIEFDRLCNLKKHPLEVLDQMKKKPGAYMPEVLAAMVGIEAVTPASRTRLVPVSELATGMVMAEDLCGERGLILVGKGQAVTATFAARLSSVGYGLARGQMCKVRA
jgi:response regulator RpfG family c-di-GMP phosphodiesterase